MINFLPSLEMDTLFHASKFSPIGELLNNYPKGSKRVGSLQKDSA